MQLLERQLDDMSEPVAGMMRMSADDDDQADQQHELVDLGMAETDHYSVLETPWPQLCSRPVVVHAASGGLQRRQWCGCSVEAGTPDELQRWVQTGVVAEDRLVGQPIWSFQSRLASVTTEAV